MRLYKSHANPSTVPTIPQVHPPLANRYFCLYRRELSLWESSLPGNCVGSHFVTLKDFTLTSRQIYKEITRAYHVVSANAAIQSTNKHFRGHCVFLKIKSGS